MRDSAARPAVFALVVVLAALHQDAWLWDDPTLVAGFLPAGLAWHASFSLVAAAVWGVVIVWAWPSDPFEGEDSP